MLLSELLRKTEYNAAVCEAEIDHITCNSREARHGSLFVCIKGFSTDGHLYAESAYKNGCRAFVAEHTIDGLPSDASVIRVADSRRALAVLSCALYGYPSEELTVIGITGTKGKTTTALMIKQLLDGVGIPTGYVGSNGISYGKYKFDTTNTTPESYKLQMSLRDMVDAGMKAVVIEVSSQALSMSRVLGVSFDIAIFTNLSSDHIGPGEHESFGDYMSAKKRLFDEYSPRLVIANADEPYTERMLADCRSAKLYYSLKGASDFRAENISLYRDGGVLGTSFNCVTRQEHSRFVLGIPGEFNIYNALAAIAVGKRLGATSEEMARILARMKIDGRFETVDTDLGACFMIDYAHNGLSLTSALKALRCYSPTRLICLFGSVGERTQVRRIQLGRAAAENADLSIITADNPGHEDPQCIIDDIATQYSSDTPYVSIPDRKEAIRYAVSIARDGDIILLAGKGHERYQKIGGCNEYFCEREIIEDCINEIRLEPSAGAK